MKMIVAIEASGRSATDAAYYRESFGLDIFSKLFDVEVMSAAKGSEIRTAATSGKEFASECRSILEWKAKREDFFLYSAPIYWGPYMTKSLGIKTVVRYGLSIENLKLCEKDGCSHGHYATYMLAKLFGRRFWHSDVWFHAVSKAMQRELLNMGIEKQRIAQIYSVPDTKKYAPKKGRKKHSSSFLFVTQNLAEKRKAPELLVEAAALLQQRGVEARFVCTGYNRRWLYRKIAGRGAKLMKSFDLVGIVPAQRLIALYRSSYFGVHPTLTEGFPRSVLEGMSCGLPWMSTRVDGMDEIMDKGSGLFFSSSEELAERIARVLKSREKRDTMAQAARRKMVAMRRPLLREYKSFFQEVGVI